LRPRHYRALSSARSRRLVEFLFRCRSGTSAALLRSLKPSGRSWPAIELEIEPVVPRAPGRTATTSQGQQRVVVIALELAEIEVIEQARGVRPVLLLDDVSSELDEVHTRALFATLRRENGQVLLTTTRPELIDTEGLGGADERRDFRMVNGQVLPG
jgi:hypothetical protein